MQLVFFRFEIFEELPNGIHHERALVRGEEAERCVEGNTARSSRFFEIVEVNAVPRFRPRFDGALVQ